MLSINIKTNYSLMSSLVDIDELVLKAHELNITALGICDTNMYGVMKFYKACLKHNIKPIIGFEVNDELSLYAKGNIGYKSLIKLASINSKHIITKEDLLKHNSDLIAVTTNYDEYRKIYNDIFIGYNNEQEKEDALNKSDKVIFNKKILFLNKNEGKYINYLYLIRDGKTIDNITDYNLSNTNYLEGMKNEYFENSVNIEFVKKVQIPNFPHDGTDGFLYLKKLCEKGLKKRLNSKITEEYVNRLNYELKVIKEMNFENYFLIVQDYVKFAKKNKIFVCPGRGSAAGSLVSYSIGITDIDPIEYKLLFERFLNPERVSMPDIDIDFDAERRDEVINYVVNKYGENKVAGIITFGTFGAKQAIRDVSRIFKIDNNIVNKLSKLIEASKSLENNYLNNNKFKSLIDSNDEYKKVYNVARIIEKNPRHTSIHAAGIVMSDNNLDELIPVNKSDDSIYLTGYSMEYLEELGLIKMDFLGIKNLTLISKVINEIGIDFNKIPLDDKKTFDLFNKALTSGIFQFESEGIKNVLRKFPISEFNDLVAIMALYRPGPMENIDTFINRKKGLEPVVYYHKSLESILKSTYGIIVYQEQIMQIAVLMANYTMAEADILRSAMAKKKKKVLEKEEIKFVNQSISNGYTKEESKKVYDLIFKFADYGFNLSHSVGYSLIAYKMGYLKANYNAIFMSYLLNMVLGSEIKIKEYIYECKLNNIEIIMPDINESDYEFTYKDNKINYALSAISNISLRTAMQIIEERNERNYEGFFDFVARNYGRNVNRKAIESLIVAGAFKSNNVNTLLFNLDNAINYAELIKDLDSSLIEKPELIAKDELSSYELMKKELEVFGFYLSNHPVTSYKKEYKTIELENIDKYFDKVIDVIVIVDKIKEITTKKGDKMAFISGTSETSKIDITLFPDIYKKYSGISKNDVLLIKGKVEKRFSKVQVIAAQIKVLNNLNK